MKAIDILPDLNQRPVSKGSECTLVIGDTHWPYGHPSSLSFISAIADKFCPDRVLHIGDETDGHAYSFHNADGELLSPGAEFKKARAHAQGYFKLFPKMQLMESNHGSLLYRKAKFHGIPREALRPYCEMLETPTWTWHDDLQILMSNGSLFYFCHGRTGTSNKLSRNLAMSTVQGHFHSKAEITTWANSQGQVFFDCYTGCLVDQRCLSQAYNKLTLSRPMLSSLVIIKGIPQLIPMNLDRVGRWDRKL